MACIILLGEKFQLKKRIYMKIIILKYLYQQCLIQETIDTDICPAYSTSTFIKNYSSDYVDAVVYNEVQ